ncbi:MAG: hypothetical protein ACJAXW_002182 [Candidatus Azotimanducaceae bacterium]|jgi:hypothetical protein
MFKPNANLFKSLILAVQLVLILRLFSWMTLQTPRDNV